jgi:D-threo-aldose 1-dehydrogenase
MRSVQLPNGRVTTCLGFGCGGLVGGVSASASRRLVEAAFEAGIRHFDVAPSYGLGTAEDVLGSVLPSCRDQVTIATKVGIGRPRASKILALARAMSKPILKLVPAIKRIVSKKVGDTKPRNLFDVGYVRQTLADSLLRLRTEGVDLYLMHEMQTEKEVSPALIQFLVECRQAGLLGGVGTGTSRFAALKLSAQFPELFEVCQFPWSVLDPPILAQERALIITHGAIRRALDLLSRYFDQDAGLAREWSELLNQDLRSRAVVADLLLAAAIGENPNGIVLVSSSRIDRIERFAKVANDANLLVVGGRFRDIIQSSGRIPRNPKESQP